MPGRQDWQTWPAYEAAVLGFRNYWYPVDWSRKVGRKPLELTLLGERLALVREGSVVRATRVGVETAASAGSEESLEYRTYPTAERLGIVWVYVGDLTDGQPPPPPEDDMPSELLADDAVVVGRITRRPGNWRFGAENGFDEGHAKYLHRRALWVLRRQMPTWVRHHIEPTGEGWITRVPDEVHYDTEFPTLGWWPPKRWWRVSGRGKATVSIRLPCFLRVAYLHWQHYEWWVPIDEGHHVYIQLVSKRAGRLERARFRFYYWAWIRWVFHGMFNDEDALMVDVMDAPPERLYRPDVALTEWRKLCEAQTRGVPQTITPEMQQLAASEHRPEIRGLRHAGMPLTHRIRELLRQ
jgi:hypothetical protein